MLITVLKEVVFLLCCLCVFLVMRDHAQGMRVVDSIKQRAFQCFANPLVFGVIRLGILVLVVYFIYSLIWGK